MGPSRQLAITRAFEDGFDLTVFIPRGRTVEACLAPAILLFTGLKMGLMEWQPSSIAHDPPIATQRSDRVSIASFNAPG